MRAAISPLSAKPLPVAVVITGGIGAGKSAFCQWLRQQAEVAWLDADQVGHQLLASSPSIQTELRRHFGDGIFAADGAVDRALLAERVFQSPGDLICLEALLHPPIQEYLVREVEALKRRGDLVMVLAEIPLLVEAGLPAWCDLVVTIESDLMQRTERLARRGLSPTQIQKRMDRQTSDPGRRLLADLIIDNNGDLDLLNRCAKLFWEEMLRLAPPDGRWK